MVHIDHQKNRCQQSFFHNTKMSMYREAKNTQTNIEKKKERNCKARRQKITDNKYTEQERKRETTPAKNFKIGLR